MTNELNTSLNKKSLMAFFVKCEAVFLMNFMFICSISQQCTQQQGLAEEASSWEKNANFCVLLDDALMKQIGGI